MKRLLASILSLFIAGCAGRRNETSSSPDEAAEDSGLSLKVELVKEDRAEMPRGIRLTVENASGAVLSFPEPRPMCPQEMQEGMEITPLALVFTNSSGQTLPCTPFLTEHFQANLEAPKNRTLAPGESWSETYELDRLYLWGPCGPAIPISEVLEADRTGIQLQVVVYSRNGSAMSSQPLHVPYTVSSKLFDEPGRGVSEVDSEESRHAEEEAFAREEARRRAAALRAIRGSLHDGARETEHDGEPIGEWLDRYCGPSRWRDDTFEESRLQARNAMVELGPEAVPFLIKALGIEDDLSECAAELLGNLHEEGKVPDHVLVDALRSGSEQTTRGVLEALNAESASPAKRARVLSPELTTALIELLKDSDLLFERYLVPAALARPGLGAAVPALIESLKDGDKGVRLSAARALVAIGPQAAESIPALKTMATSLDSIEKRTARSALIALGETPSGFADFRERVETYIQRRLATEPVQQSKEPLLGNIPTASSGVFFLVDRSGSSRQGFQFSRSYIPKVVSTLEEDCELGVVFVDSRALSHPDGGKPAKAGEKERAALLGFVLETKGGTGSCLAKGFDAVLDFAEASRAGRKIIIYIGDGGATCMGANEVEMLEKICEQVTARNAGGAEIHAIGVGAGKLGEAVLLYLTEQNGGTYSRLVTE